MTSEPAPKSRVVIAGGTGFLGLNLATHLAAEGHEVVLISRNAPGQDGPWVHTKWDGRSVGDWAGHLEGAAALVNLAGRTVDCIKTPNHCDEILRSRVDSVQALGQALREIKHPPALWVQMATAHIYGDPPETICDEDSSFGHGLAPIVGNAWEKAYREHVPTGMRQVILRTSFVLGKSGGAFPKMKMLARLGLGGRVSHGRQGISWIHEQDMNRLMARAISDREMQGIYVATAPGPVSQARFMRELRCAIRMPVGLPVAGWMVRLGARYLLRTDPELVLYGRYCVSRRLEKEGFEFKFPGIEEALRELCTRQTAP
jgi:uncharacterized protein (TIGR01777 family)